MILSIAGGTSSTSTTAASQPDGTSKAGIALYIVGYAVLILIAFIAAAKLSSGPKDDRRLAWTTILAFPFIGVRLLYSVLAIFSHIKVFRPVTGSVVVHVFMAVLVEWIVVLMYVAVGWVTTATAPEARGPIASRPWKGNKGGGAGRGRRGHGGRSQGPIHALVSAGVARAQERAQDRGQQRGQGDEYTRGHGDEYARGPTNV
jgi:hypothetical protein